ncbi:MAG TPA: hypothetical protein DGH68_05180, partial [Bacteroidetes bacterium]|nr:hypothetical protein [Bacteroidota bacterium]
MPIQGNPYERVDEYTQHRQAFNRERWFYEQRMYPFNALPENAYGRALQQRDEMRAAKGFFSSPSSVRWTNIGPTSGYYFSYGNISSRITTIKYDPNNPGNVYLGAAFGGVWKSTDAGLTWTEKTDHEASLSSGAIAIDPTNSNVIYYGTGEATYSGASYYGRGLLKSTNGGTTWTNYAASFPSTTYFSRIVIRPGRSSELLAALGNSSGGLHRSTDAGVTWVRLVAGRADDVVFTPSGDTAYAVGSGIGFRVSTDGGQTFVTQTPVSMQTRNHIAICRTSPNIMYFAHHSSSIGINVYKSTDAGATFTQVAVGTNFNGGQAWYDFYMHVNPFDPNYAYVGSIDVWRTTDGGSTFQNITNGYSGGSVHVDQHNVDFHPSDPNQMFCVNDGGVWKSTDRGTSWTNLNATLTLTQFYRMTSDPSNFLHLMGGTQDNGTQRTTGSINWIAAFGGDGGDVCFQSQDNMKVLGETQNNGVQRSLSGGGSWSSATTGLSGSGAWVGPLISHPDSSDIFYTARAQVFKTTKPGALWFPISSGTSGTIREMDISRTSPKVMYATSAGQVYKSSDGGLNFTLVSTGMPTRTITSVHVHPDSENVVLVSFSGFGAGKVYRSLDGGTTWNNISSNLPDTPVNDVLIYHPGFPTSSYLAASDIGVFISNDYGATWTELADGLPNTVAIHLDYNLQGNKIRIGTHGRGVYETSIVTGVINYTNDQPTDFKLFQNFPNPFNPTTTIKYTLSLGGRGGVRSHVTLKVYDLLGRD